MRELIAIIAGAIPLAGVVPYVLDIIRGKTKPNIVSWFTWTLLAGIGAVAAWSDGAVTTAIFSGASAISTGIVVILGLRGCATLGERRTKKPGRLLRRIRPGRRSSFLWSPSLLLLP